MNIIDKLILKFFSYLDDLSEKINDVVTFDVGQENKKSHSKRTYKKAKDHGTDITFENEIKK